MTSNRSPTLPPLVAASLRAAAQRRHRALQCIQELGWRQPAAELHVASSGLLLLENGPHLWHRTRRGAVSQGVERSAAHTYLTACLCTSGSWELGWQLNPAILTMPRKLR